MVKLSGSPAVNRMTICAESRKPIFSVGREGYTVKIPLMTRPAVGPQLPIVSLNMT